MDNLSSSQTASQSNRAGIVIAHGDSRIQVGDIYYQSEDRCLADLRCTDPRDDKSRIEQTKGGLLRDAYKWVLANDEFQQWRLDDESSLLWVRGDPGKGKTMLLCGIIDELKNSGTDLVSFFFCQATDTRINSATAMLRGLIYLIVKQQPSLGKHVRERYDGVGKQLFEDVNAWTALSRILTDILRDPNLQSTFLVIDAIDECVTGLPLLLDFIAQQSCTPSRVKWLVSSRNWPSIETRLKRATRKARLSLELNEDLIAAAVGVYIRSRVDDLAQTQTYDQRTHDAVFRYLSSNANDTFLWVALVCQSLQDVPQGLVPDTLVSFPPGLNSLYQRMMEHIRDSVCADLCKQILATISTVYRPITVTELRALVGTLRDMSDDQQSLSHIIRLCGSFLTLRANTIYFVHQSAKEFLLQKESILIFPSGLEQLHYSVFSASLCAVSQVLSRDIYNLRRPGDPIGSITSPDPDPLAIVRYACVYWIHHLRNCDPTSNATSDLQDGGSIARFLTSKYLNWLEALSLLGSIPEGITSMLRLKSLLQGHTSALANFVRDACRFIQYHQWAVENSPLQVYASSLVFSPTHSLVRNCFQKEEPRWVTTKPIVEKDWNACIATLEGHSGPVWSVAWSQETGEAARIASASDDKTVKIWEAATGRCIATLEGHSGPVWSVAWSQETGEAARIASASDDNTVKIWEAATGRCIATLEGHSDYVWSVAWSQETGEAARIASASYDKTVKIWEAATGRCIATLEGHSGPVWSVAWSQETGEAARIASASDDNTVKIWEAATGRCIATLYVGRSVEHLWFGKSKPYLLRTDIGTFDLRSAASSAFSSTSSLGHLTSSLHHYSYSLNTDNNWITYNGQNILWLPQEYRPLASAISGAAVVIGCPSGRVLILRFSESGPISKNDL